MFEQKKTNMAVVGKDESKPTGPVEKEYLTSTDQRGI
jgi:hypothetical protein